MRRPNHSRLAFVAVAVATLVVVGCSGGRAYCSKEAQCLAEEEDVELESDSVGVCVAQYDGNIAALRANEEPECQVLADAIVAADACRASLDCNDFFDAADYQDACEDELDDLQDALNDVDDGRCSAQES
ncbi:MAG: hypothetical protein FJ137_15120 [Deltaproteobacteria bacterium]|nr:hypothetical protein [Deltaproteobacteria bacterium]